MHLLKALHSQQIPGRLFRHSKINPYKIIRYPTTKPFKRGIYEDTKVKKNLFLQEKHLFILLPHLTFKNLLKKPETYDATALVLPR